MLIKDISYFTSNYPSPAFPHRGVFVERTIKSWTEKGINVNVINPQSINDYSKGVFRKKHVVRRAGTHIISPKYLSFSNKNIAGIDFQKLSNQSLMRAFLKAKQKLKVSDMFFGKFLNSGAKAAGIAKNIYNKPAFADLGESKLTHILDEKKMVEAREIVKNMDGIFCVSNRIVSEVLALGANKENVYLVPNSVDINLFKKLDKIECRNKLNLPHDKFIVIFVGYYRHRKGPLRVLEAINKLNNNIKGIFIGYGEQSIKGDRVIKTGSIENNQLPLWINAADVFVLPTLAEGHCNAINEALACGTPVITSRIDDVMKNLPEDICTYVNPLNTDEIAEAINSLMIDKAKRIEYSKKSIKYSGVAFKYDRANIILDTCLRIVSNE